MKRGRPLTKQEVIKVSKNFKNIRDKSIFLFGINTGGRISELMSLQVKDVWNNGKVRNVVAFPEGKSVARTVPLNDDAKKAVCQAIEFIKQWRTLTLDCPLFPSAVEIKNPQPLHRVSAYRILSEAYDKAGLDGIVNAHSMRHTFATMIFENSNIFITQDLLGHVSPAGTVYYVDYIVTERDKKQAVKF